MHVCTHTNEKSVKVNKQTHKNEGLGDGSVGKAHAMQARRMELGASEPT